MSRINYNLTQIKGIVFDIDGVLSPSTIPMDIDGNPLRMVNIKDGYAIQLAVNHNYKIAIITGAFSKAIDVRYNGLGVKDVFQKVAMKKPVLLSWMKDNGLSPEEVAYVGDDIPDLECLQTVGLSVCPADAAEEVKANSVFISKATGGHGVGRELIEEIMKASGCWMSSEKAFGW